MVYNKQEKRNQSHKVSALEIKGKKTFKKTAHTFSNPKTLLLRNFIV